MSVQYIVNETSVTVLEEDDAMLRKLRGDPAFITAMIESMVKNYQIFVDGPIYRIAVQEGDFERTIFTAPKKAPATQPADDRENMNPNSSSKSVSCSSMSSELPSTHTVQQPCGTSVDVKNEKKKNDLWTAAQTEFLLEKYYLYMSQVGPMKQFKTRKAMWSRMAEDYRKELNVVKTALQVENRWKTVLRRKKTAVDNNAQSGSSRQEVEFESQLKKIAALDDSIQPELIRSAKNLKALKKNETMTNESDPENYALTKRARRCSGAASTNKKKTAAEILAGIHVEKEEAKQRRHVEKLKLLRDLIGENKKH